MRRLIHGLDLATSVLSRVAVAVAGLTTLLCLALVGFAVGMRYFFGRPYSWTDEVSGFLIVVLVMLAVAEAQRRDEHIGVDLLLERMRGRAHRAVRAAGAFCVAVAAGILVWQGWETVAFTHMLGLKPLAVPEAPLWAIQALIPAGGALMFLVALAQMLKLLAGDQPAPEADAPPRATE